MTQTDVTAWVDQADRPSMTPEKMAAWAEAIEQQAMEIVAFGQALAVQAQTIQLWIASCPLQPPR